MPEQVFEQEGIVLHAAIDQTKIVAQPDEPVLGGGAGRNPMGKVPQLGRRHGSDLIDLLDDARTILPVELPSLRSKRLVKSIACCIMLLLRWLDWLV